MNKKLCELSGQPYTGRSANHKLELERLGLDPNSPMPTKQDLDNSFVRLRPFFNRIDEYHKEFLRLSAVGKC